MAVAILIFAVSDLGMTTLSELSSVGFSDSAETDPLRSRDWVWWVWGGRESCSVFRGVSWSLRGREGEKGRGGVDVQDIGE